MRVARVNAHAVIDLDHIAIGPLGSGPDDSARRSRAHGRAKRTAEIDSRMKCGTPCEGIDTRAEIARFLDARAVNRLCQWHMAHDDGQRIELRRRNGRTLIFGLERLVLDAVEMER